MKRAKRKGGGHQQPRPDWDPFARAFDQALRLRNGETLTTARLVKLYAISRPTAVRDLGRLRALLRRDDDVRPGVPNPLRLSDGQAR